jgi:activator of HSP90 ATPase
MAIHREATFPVPPERIYELLTDAARFSIVVNRRGRGGGTEGAWFSLFGDQLEGRQIELVRPERVVQAWRLSEWEQGVYSIVRFTLAPEGPGTRVVVDQDGYPANFHDRLANSWRPMYFEPMARHFSDALGAFPSDLSGVDQSCGESKEPT